MQKIKTVHRTSDGSTYDTLREAEQHQAKLNGLNFVCPKCKGECSISDTSKPIYGQEIKYRESEYSNGSFFSQPEQYRDVIGYQKITCDLCNGQGYTQKEIKPVYETTSRLIGYK